MMKKDTPGRSGKSDKEKSYKKNAGGSSFRDDKKPSYKRNDSEGDRPKRSYKSEDKPDRSNKFTGEDRPKRSFSSDKRSASRDDKPKRSYGDDKDRGKWEDRPKRTHNADDSGERPKRSYGGDKRSGSWDDKPKRSYSDNKDKGKWEDRPKRTHSADDGGERPKRSYGSDKRSGSWDDKPKRSYSDDKDKGKWEDRPKRTHSTDDSGERPKRSYGGDKRSDSRDDKPKRTFGDDRDKAKWEDRSKKENGEKSYERKDKKSFGKGGGKSKPSFRKKEEDTRPFPFSDIKVSGPFRKNYQADKQSKPESTDRKRKAKGEEQETGEVKELTLNTYIAHSGVCSRREAAELVKQGKVKVNDELMLDPGYRVKEYDQVTIAGKKLAPQKDRVYILLNKPKDFITTTDDPEGRKTVMDLVENSGHSRLFPVGRLDRQTTGLLLLTNDGDLAQKLAHPSNEIKKVYQVTLDKSLTKAHFEKIVSGVELEDGMAHVDALAYLDTKSELGLEIHSGRNRIVRRIFESLGYTVEKLDRVMYAGLTKKNLPRGQWRLLQEKEVILLKHFKS